MPEASYLKVSQKIGGVSLAISLSLALFVFASLFNFTSTLSRIYITNFKDTEAQEEKEQRWENPKADKSIFCDRTHFDYDMCHLNRPTILDPTTATFFTTDPTNSTQQQTEKIHPHPRILNTPIHLVRELTLTSVSPNVSCAVTHTSPALVFSAGGWTGNFFHDMSDRFIPLFITVETFFPDHDFVLGIFNCSDWWMHRYINLLSGHTRRQILNLDKETVIHCFPSVIVGLISHGPTVLDPTLQRTPHPKTLRNFRAFLTTIYASNTTLLSNTNENVFPLPQTSLPWKLEGRPRLVILNRKGARSILNIDKVQQMAEDVGFEVFIFEPTNQTSLHEAFRLVHNSHALIGVHGAALTNILFLRPGSVVVQMVPPKCGWLADLCFGKMAIRLGLQYMIYNVREDESILELDKPTRDWLAQRVTQIEIWAVYRNQLLKLDLIRVKRYLKRAYKKAKLLMHKV